MIINLEITFIANFIINTTILFISSYLVNYKYKLRIIIFSLIFSLCTIFTLYINNYIIYIIVKSVLILIFPLVIIIKSHVRNLFTIVASFLLICGVAVIISQYLKYSFWTSIVISFSLIIFVGVVPRFISKAKENEGLVTLRINEHKIRAYVDSGILLPATSCEDINIILNEDIAKIALTSEQYQRLINDENLLEFETASTQNISMAWIDIDDILVKRKNKCTKLNSKVYLSKVRLPYDALISSLNI